MMKTPHSADLTEAEGVRMCARGTGGFPPNPPSVPLIVSFPSKAAACDYFHADGKWLSQI